MNGYLCIRCQCELELIDTEKGRRGVCHNNNCSAYMRVQLLSDSFDYEEETEESEE